MKQSEISLTEMLELGWKIVDHFPWPETTNFRNSDHQKSLIRVSIQLSFATPLNVLVQINIDLFFLFGFFFRFFFFFF